MTPTRTTTPGTPTTETTTGGASSTATGSPSPPAPVGERWRAVAGFEGAYEVSDAGRVRSLPRVVRRGYRGRPGRCRCPVPGGVLAASPDTHGRLRVHLSHPHGGQPRTYGVDLLVLVAFVGPCPPGWESCHLDGDKTNNRLDNLAWVPRAVNPARHRRGPRAACPGEAGGGRFHREVPAADLMAPPTETSR